MKKRIVIAIIALAVLVAAALLFFRRTPFHYSGVAEAVEVDISSRLNDTIAEIFAEEGAPVKKGQTLARLTCDEANLKHNISQTEFNRAAQLLKTTAGSRENYDLKKNAYDQAALQKSWCELVSPLDGQVLYKYYEPGEFIAAGKKMLTVADLRELDVWVYVPYAELANLSVGQEVKGYLPEADKTFAGKILAINDQSEFTPKNVQTREERTRLVYGVKTRFANDEHLTVKPGMTLETEFVK
ncbi:MAG: HlyD family efflux transporter periplasmic adaptor subunit [Elusimicrobiales bacterium]|nr:HlyD family efflux transporter periplasmic adaptor subunit [Elusimicrobiales bacterium]